MFTFLPDVFQDEISQAQAVFTVTAWEQGDIVTAVTQSESLVVKKPRWHIHNYCKQKLNPGRAPAKLNKSQLLQVGSEM